MTAPPLPARHRRKQAQQRRMLASRPGREAVYAALATACPRYLRLAAALSAHDRARPRDAGEMRAWMERGRKLDNAFVHSYCRIEALVSALRYPDSFECCGHRFRRNSRPPVLLIDQVPAAGEPEPAGPSRRKRFV
jgi:hypothetical protein